MNCGRPDCTGVHTETRPRAERCPRTIELERERARHYRARHPARRALTLVRDNARRRKGLG